MNVPGNHQGILFSFWFFFNIYLFNYLAALGLSCGLQDLHGGSQASLQLWRLRSGAHGLSSCPVACGILVPQPGIEPASPALEGRFLTTGPPGKSLGHLVNNADSHSGLGWCLRFYFSNQLPGDADSARPGTSF